MIEPQITWQEPVAVSPPPEIANFFPDFPLLNDILYRRKFTTSEQIQSFLNPEDYQPANPFDFPGMQSAVDILTTAIAQNKTIGVWGDFDVDGQTATAVLVGSLRQLKSNVIYHLPVRSKESHGITIPALQEFLDMGVQVLLTCDTGITAHEAIEFAKQRGVQVIITDHHSLPQDLPPADAIIHPHLLPDHHPARSLCGVGAAWELATALFEHHQMTGKTGEYLDLVALGTVADLAQLTGDNRYFVQKGLSCIRSQPRSIIQEIFVNTETRLEFFNEEHISFVIAPRLNALGRLGDANPAVEMLLSEDISASRLFVSQLEALNARRKFMTEQVFQSARLQIENNPDLLTKPLLILAHPEWPGGIVGIVASRIAELYRKPALVISSPAGELARGSARSIEGLDITASLAANQTLLTNFGGHPMAAGFSLPSENLEQFRFGMERTVEKAVITAPLMQTLAIDAFLTLPEITLDFVEQLERLSPFGAGNPPITFACENLTIQSKTALGRDGEHLRLVLEDENGNLGQAILWQADTYDIPANPFDLAFTLRVSDYKGVRSPQIEWVSTRSNKELIQITEESSQTQYLDFRNDLDAGLIWLKQQPEEAYFIWSEGAARTTIPGSGRNQFVPAETLIIAGIPPNRQVLQQAMQLVTPRKVVLFGLPSAKDDIKEFLAQLIGVARFALKNKDGIFHLSDLQLVTAQSDKTIQTGIALINALGDFTINEESPGCYQVIQSGIQNKIAANNLQQTLLSLLMETSAFRAYFCRVVPEQLFQGMQLPDQRIKK